MLISIVIPAHNRPELLLEAIHSIANQTYSNFEVIVIDDGSIPPISATDLQQVLGNRVIYHRHDSAQGIPKTKNKGVALAHGEVILIHDDDDLLMPDALEQIFQAFSKHQSIDCLFMGVQPFGSYADGVIKNRIKAISKVFEQSKPKELEDLYFFSDNLFSALLETVPIDFQRPAARRSMWNIVGGFDENSLFSESTWSIRASYTGTIALTKSPITKWRIHDSNFGWPSDLDLDEIKIRQIDNQINASIQLLEIFNKEEKSWEFRRNMIIKHHANQLFSSAYYLRRKDWPKGLRLLFQSFLLKPSFIHLKLAVKYFLPID